MMATRLFALIGPGNGGASNRLTSGGAIGKSAMRQCSGSIELGLPCLHPMLSLFAGIAYSRPGHPAAVVHESPYLATRLILWLQKSNTKDRADSHENCSDRL